MKKTLSFFLLLLAVLFPLYSDELLLRENFKKAESGDFIVTSQSKNYTLLHIYDKTPNILTIEEITVPEKKINAKKINWRNWVAEMAPGSSSWVMYQIDLNSGEMKNFYSFSKNSWYDIPEADNFLSTLLNLRLYKIDERYRKKVGHGRRALWNPKMYVDGQEIKGVPFDAWKAYWPNDGTELAGKTIEVYLPQDEEEYLSYFPYWLQISGTIAKAKVRIIDSGYDLSSPMPPLLTIK